MSTTPSTAIEKSTSWPCAVLSQSGDIQGVNASWEKVFGSTEQSGTELDAVVQFLSFPQASHAIQLALGIGFMAFPCAVRSGSSEVSGGVQLLLVSKGGSGECLAYLLPMAGSRLSDNHSRGAPGSAAVSGSRALGGEDGWAGEAEVSALNDGDDLGLTDRELQVVALLAKGLTSTRTAEHLAISESTVQAHIRNAMRKARCRNRTSLVALAVANGLVKS